MQNCGSAWTSKWNHQMPMHRILCCLLGRRIIDRPPDRQTSQIARLVAGVTPQFEKMAIRLQTILIPTRHERDLATNVATLFAFLSAIFGERAA
jgi:hypothetical protein